MNTPVCDFVESYVRKNPLRLHMPGHKGVNFTGAEERDITEVVGADVLYRARGVIAESENNASALYGSGKTLYSCEGSSLCIRAMLYLAILAAGRGGEKADGQGREKPLVLAARNAHKTFFTAAALLDFDTEWLYGDEDGGLIGCRVTAKQVEQAIADCKKRGRAPIAVYLTSPDYLGNLAEISSIGAVCKKHGILLLVDNAHGAYLKFLDRSLHPLDLGADLCCDSAHKTLSVLTGGAYLHISKRLEKDVFRLLCENAERAMGLFASTSPSYLILQSLDRSNAVTAGENYRETLRGYAAFSADLKQALRGVGYEIAGEEPMKLTLCPKPYGYAGEAIAAYLQESGIECEFSDRDFSVCMFTPFLEENCFERLKTALLSLPRRAAIRERPPKVLPKKRALSPREALFLPSETLPVEECLGKIVTEESVVCPPAVPIVSCGEIVDENAVELFRYYGEKECRVAIL